MIAYKEHMVSTERLDAVRQKYADYDDLKAKANANDETKSELEQLRERAESTEKKQTNSNTRTSYENGQNNS